MVAAAKPITVLVADASETERFGLCSVLGADPRFAVASESVANVISAALRLQPDLIVVDPCEGDSIDQSVIGDLRIAAFVRPARRAHGVAREAGL